MNDSKMQTPALPMDWNGNSDSLRREVVGGLLVAAGTLQSARYVEELPAIYQQILATAESLRLHGEMISAALPVKLQWWDDAELTVSLLTSHVEPPEGLEGAVEAAALKWLAENDHEPKQQMRIQLDIVT